MKVAVTLAVPCYDAARTLGPVLAGVRRQAVAPDEVLVIDDGSRDDTARLARRLGARLEQHERNRGLAAARNTALEHASGDVVVFVDADAVPHPDLVRRLTAGYDDDARLAAVGGQILEIGGASAVDRWRAAFWRQTLGDRPLDDASISVDRVFPSLSFSDPIAMVQIPGDDSAWYLIEHGAADELVEERLGEALRWGPPMFTSGLRLLIDALQVMPGAGPGGAARRQLDAYADAAWWEAPLTTFRVRGGAGEPRGGVSGAHRGGD